MSYLIDARLERGAPSLTLFDAETGEERLHWRCENTANPESAWQTLFKRLTLLSCADRLSLVQHARSSAFGEECVECNVCAEQPPTLKSDNVLLMALKHSVFKTREKVQ